MSTRYSKVKDALLRYRLKTKEKKAHFMEYLREERQKIVARERKKLVRRMLFWAVFLGGGSLIYEEIYRKKVEKSKMTKKLDHLYGGICQREELREELSATLLSPQTLDELANIVSLAYRYHYKVIVRMDDISKKEKINITEQFDGKCLFLNLAALSRVDINPINNTVYSEAGATCQQVNHHLLKAGYAPLFPEDLNSEKIYDVIVNNLPLNNGELSKTAISLELLSASGQSFRSAGETNRYGQIPSLNPLFIGTGGIFALPCAVTLRITPQRSGLAEEALKIDIRDVNEQVASLRRLGKVDDYVDIELTNVWAGRQEDQLYAVCRERQPTQRESFSVCSQLAQSQNVPVSPLQPDHRRTAYNLYFSVNPTIFQDFLLKSWRLPYECRNGLLKVRAEEENH